MTTQEPTDAEIAAHMTEQILSQGGPKRGQMVMPHATAMAFESGVDSSQQGYVRVRIEHAAGTTEVLIPASSIDNITEGLRKAKENAQEAARKAIAVPQRAPLIIPGMTPQGRPPT